MAGDGTSKSVGKGWSFKNFSLKKRATKCGAYLNLGSSIWNIWINESNKDLITTELKEFPYNSNTSDLIKCVLYI